MIKSKKEDIDHANILKNRNSIIKFRNMCKSKLYPYSQGYELDFKWLDLYHEFENLLFDYDHDVKLNEVILISMYDINKISNNVIIITRLVKLIRIV